MQRELDLIWKAIDEINERIAEKPNRRRPRSPSPSPPPRKQHYSRYAVHMSRVPRDLNIDDLHQHCTDFYGPVKKIYEGQGWLNVEFTTTDGQLKCLDDSEDIEKRWGIRSSPRIIK